MRFIVCVHYLLCFWSARILSWKLLCKDTYMSFHKRNKLIKKNEIKCKHTQKKLKFKTQIISIFIFPVVSLFLVFIQWIFKNKHTQILLIIPLLNYLKVINFFMCWIELIDFQMLLLIITVINSYYLHIQFLIFLILQQLLFVSINTVFDIVKNSPVSFELNFICDNFTLIDVSN